MSRFRRHAWLGRTLLLLIVAVSMCIPGCGGCSCRSNPNRAKTPEELEKELEERAARLREQEQKKPLRELRYASLPHGPMGGFPKPGENTQTFCFLKPGHWVPLTFSAVANNFDIAGNLELAAGEETALPGMKFSVSTERSVALPKGQAKTFETVFYLPEDLTVPMRGTLDARRRSGGYYSLFPAVARMPYYQFHFVVLARYPESYTYLRALDAVSNRTNDHYRLSLLSPGQRTPLPAQALLWTSTAYVLWDDADPEGLSLDQQVALLDWIHWGGQLIVSGPETLETLKSSFVEDYLPARSEGTRPLTAGDFEEINRYWTLPIRGMPAQSLAPISPWSGVKLKKHAQARDVPKTGGLVVERRVGRGRVVVSAFKLSSQELVGWSGWDGFFNGCLMRRPSRRFATNVVGGELDDYSIAWAGRSGDASRYNTQYISQLRYFSRDTGRRPSEATIETIAMGEGDGSSPLAFSVAAPADDGQQRVPVMNYGAWNDFNAVADGARDILDGASGIDVPERSFIVWVVLGYLVVLVPLNWLFFRMLGRVEWAWAAAPVIAIACAIVVIRQAQLDIGFVRSENEAAVLEIQGDYPRGHLARYSSFYTSLGTSYDFEFDDLGAQILPFSEERDRRAGGLAFGEAPERVRYEYGAQVRLKELPVRSSSAQWTHSEQMVDLGGNLRWFEASPGMHRLENRTGHRLHDAGVVRKTGEGRLITAWLGTIEPEGRADVAGRWQPGPDEDGDEGLWPDRREGSAATGRGGALGAITLSPLIVLAEKTGPMEPGDARLVAWTDEPLGGMEVHPAAPQRRRLTLIVANLSYGFGEEPAPDQNSRHDVTAREPVFREGVVVPKDGEPAERGGEAAAGGEADEPAPIAP
ncbi:MAG: hypothetical protein ACYC6Y_18280 [Thermoguttaceae bacterium]